MFAGSYKAMLNKIESLFTEAKKAIESASTTEGLYETKVKYLGKSGSLSGILKEMGKLTPDDRKTIGKRANEVRDALDAQYNQKESALKSQELGKKLETERIDVTLPGIQGGLGGIHPIAKVTKEICDIFAKIGF